MATSDISICNTALLMIGADDINSFSDATAEAKLAKAIYIDTYNTLLQYHPWRFSLRQVDLGGAINADPLFKWSRKYQLPTDTLRIITIENNDDYEILEDKLYTDVNPARIVYQYRPSESKLPSYFIRALEFHLASLFAFSLQEDTAKANIFDQRADKETVRARNIDSQQQTNIKIPDRNFTFINVRG